MNVADSHVLSDLSPDGIVYINTDKEVGYINPAFLEMTGFSQDELLNLKANILGERILSLCNDRSEHAQCDISTIEHTEIMHWHSPSNKLISFTPREIRNKQGHSAGRVLYFHDITREKDRDRQVKSEFLSVAAHKLRTPLVGILGFSELLLKRDFEESQRKDVIATIYRQATNFKQLLDDFLDIERLDTRKGKDFRISTTTLEKVFDDVAADIALTTEAVEVTYEKPEQWPQLQCDAEKIKQVLVNLVSNAIKYSPSGSKVTCKTATRSSDGIVEFGLVITDNGVGMSPDELRRVGERFYRIDDSQPVSGSGLGIALVKEIMAIHHGSFEIESEKGSGTIAMAWLPVLKA